MPTHKRSQKPVVRCENVELSRFHISDLDKDNQRSKNQYIYYPRYDYRGAVGKTSFIFQTNTIKMVQGGLPKLGEHYTDDTKRDFVKVPLDPSQEACVQLRKLLEGIDQYVLDRKEEILSQIVKKKKKLQETIDLFEYQPIVRQSRPVASLADDSDDEEDDKGPLTERFDYVKMKLGTNWETKDITTKVYVRKEEGVRPQVHNVTNATELNEVLNFNCEAKYIVMANKLYVLKNAVDNKGTRKFGVTLKIVQLETKPASKSGSTKLDDYAFLGSDDEELEANEVADNESEDDEETPAPQPKVEAKVDAKKAAQELEDDSEEESEDESEDEAPVEAKKAPKKPPKKQVAQEDEEESEDDESEEESEEESEDESEDEAPVAKKPARKSRK